jgi:peptidyl-prolyl cis-trans isomerase C
MTLNFPLRGLAVFVAALAFSSTVSAQNAAMVNNKPISSSKVEALVKQLVAEGQKDGPELRGFVKDQLIGREVLTQEAERRGIARRGDVQQQLDLARQQILIQALFREELKAKPISDADVKAEYEKAVAGAAGGGGKEYRARHILIDTAKEDLAKQIIDQIKKGAKFDDLAKKESKDPGSAANGGDLNWANPSGFVKPFADAMAKLKKGEMTDTPVKSDFGWHIIRVDDIRDVTPPPMDQVKPQIMQELERQRVRKFQEDLRAKAKIQ